MNCWTALRLRKFLKPFLTAAFGCMKCTQYAQMPFGYLTYGRIGSVQLQIEALLLEKPHRRLHVQACWSRIVRTQLSEPA